MIAPLSEAALNQYPFAGIAEGIPHGVFMGVITLSVCWAVGAGVASMLNDTAPRKTLLRVMVPIVIGAFTGMLRGDLIGAKLFDAPSTVVGTVTSVSVIPGGFFSRDATNVQYDDGTAMIRGLSFVSAPAIPSGATLIKKTLDGENYYAIQSSDRPDYFQLRD